MQNNRDVKVFFHFTDHATEKDADQVGESIEKFKPHVLCMETAGTSEQIATEVETEFAKPNPLFFDRDPYYEKLHKIARVAKARVFVPERFSENIAAEINRQRQKDGQLQAEALNEFTTGNSEVALAKYHEHLEENSRNAVTREEEIKQIISNLHQHLVGKFPELEHEPEIRVLFTYGAGHTPLVMHARKSGFKTVEKKSPAPYSFSQSTTYARQQTFNKPKKYSEVEIARGLLGNVIAIHANRTSTGFSNANQYAHTMVKRATLAQFRAISKQLKEEVTRENPRTTEHATQIMQTVFERNGLKIPQTATEITNAMQKRRVRQASERQ